VGGRLQGLKRKKVFYTIREKGPVSSNLYDTSMEAFLGMLGGSDDRFRFANDVDGLARVVANSGKLFQRSIR
jgi:hypothetical protein